MALNMIQLNGNNLSTLVNTMQQIVSGATYTVADGGGVVLTDNVAVGDEIALTADTQFGIIDFYKVVNGTPVYDFILTFTGTITTP